MAKTKFISKNEILTAMKLTKSNSQAARYLKINYFTYKKYASLYIDEETGKTLFEKHKNLQGRGITKLRSKTHNDVPLERLLSGTCEFPNYPLKVLKERLIREHVLAEECTRCGFNDIRIKDYRSPLLMSFKDGNRYNWDRNNLGFICYNCYFITGGDLFENKINEHIDDFSEEFKLEDNVWEMEKSFEEHIKNTNINSSDISDYIDYKK